MCYSLFRPQKTRLFYLIKNFNFCETKDILFMPHYNMSLLNKVEQLIKKERTTPEKKGKDDSKKSSSEILSELFGVFNATPPKIENISLKKSKKSKKKHKKEKKKVKERSSSTESNREYDRKHKKRKKSKSKKRRNSDRSLTPPLLTPSPPISLSEISNIVKQEQLLKKENILKIAIKDEFDEEPSVTYNEINSVDASRIPMPTSPNTLSLDKNDLRKKLDNKKSENAANSGENIEKSKGKIQIKSLKFSAVFEEAVKKAEEEAKRKAEKFEEGEYTDSSISSVQEEVTNSQFPKSSDPGGILKKQAEKVAEDEMSKSRKSRHSDSSHKNARRKDRSRSPKRSRSKSRHRSGSISRSRRRHRHSNSWSRHNSRTRSRSRLRSRHSSRHRVRRSRSPSGVKLADSEKKRLLEVARRNAINMLKNGAVPAGAAALPFHTRNQVMAAIQSGGKSVDELTDFCKHLSKKEALGELSSVSSNDDNMSENEDTLAFHHPFLVKEKAPIVMNIRGGAPLPVKSALVAVNKDELRLQFPVSSGSQHRDKAIEWVPVPPNSKETQIAKINHKHHSKSNTSTSSEKNAIPALAAPEVPQQVQQPLLQGFSGGNKLISVPALPAITTPGPQAYPPGIKPTQDLGALVTQKLSAIRKEQEQTELAVVTPGFGWTGKSKSLGQFTGFTDAQILTPKELASGVQAWAKKDQLFRAAPVEGGMGMHLLQKMGWTPGRGLGKEESGALQPLLLEVKLDTKGLQAKEEMKHHRGQARRGAAPLIAGGKHPVSLLGEYCSKQKLGAPEYNLCFECGPDHKKNFLFKVKVGGVEYQPAVASANKKQAKADAAQLALQKLSILP